MDSIIHHVPCNQLVPYYDFQVVIQEAVAKKSLELQKKEASSLKSIPLRVLFSSGAYPRPQFKSVQVPQIPLSRNEFEKIISKSVHLVMDCMDYNGIQPFVKLIEHVSRASPLSELYLDAEGEFPSTTCVGMTEAILKTIQSHFEHQGLLVAQKKLGQEGFQHACALFYCLDGFILIDPVSDPKKRIFSLPYNDTCDLGDRQFICRYQMDLIPLEEHSKNGIFEYCAHIVNAEDLILKHYMAEEPFLNASNPAFPISTYNQDGSASKCIWISIINDTLTLKNLTYAKSDKRRTSEIDIEDVEDDELIHELRQLYDAGQPTFKTPFPQLCKKLKTFVDNIDLVKEVFASVHF